MSLAAVLTVPVVALLVLVPVAVLVHDARRTVAPSAEAARALRHAAMPAGVATCVLVLGVALVVPWAIGLPPFTGGAPSGLLLAGLPLTAAFVFLAVHAVGELTFPRPRGDVRTAALTARTADDVTPRRLRLCVATWTTTLGALLALGTVTSTGPRHVDRVVDGWISRGQPYPGSWYAVPLAGGTVVVLLATWAVLHLIATRPAVVGVDASWDDALRRRTAGRVLRGVQLSIALTAAGVLLMAAWGLRAVAAPMPSLGDGSAAPALSVLATVLLVVACLACVVGVAVALRHGTPRLLASAAPARTTP